MAVTNKIRLPCGDCDVPSQWYTWSDQCGEEYQAIRCPQCAKRSDQVNCLTSRSLGFSTEFVRNQWNKEQRKIQKKRQDVKHSVEKEVLISLLGLLTDSDAYECGHCGAHHKPEKLTAHIQTILRKL